MGGHDPLTINIVTIFPEFFETPLATSIPGRAAEAELVRYRVVDLRAFTTDRHRTVDDTPFGGSTGYARCRRGSRLRWSTRTRRCIGSSSGATCRPGGRCSTA